MAAFAGLAWSPSPASPELKMAEEPSQEAWQTSGVLPWLGVLVAWLSFGSFAVPMKWPAVVDARVHPLVYQSYKTFWVFVTSYLVLLFQPYEFSVWGLASGFSWVPAGIAAVVAVQNVGIAYGQAMWQVTVIATNFVWGFAILRDEGVRNPWIAALALVCIVLGVAGMTLAFNLRPAASVNADGLEAHLNETPAVGGADRGLEAPDHPRSSVVSVLSRASSCSTTPQSPAGSRSASMRRSFSDVRFAADDVEDFPADVSQPSAAPRSWSSEALSQPRHRKVSFALGVSAALFNGIWGGSNLVPAKYSAYHGIHFVISFSTGALVANVVLGVVYVVLAKLVWRAPLPRLELRAMAVPGLISGCLWSLGNFCSLYVLSVFGQGIGNAFLQSSVMVSGLWGILYYREMTGRPVMYWSCCCAMCLIGISLLAVEQVNPSAYVPLPTSRPASVLFRQ
eukprot:TRINITY_DN63169_c0_g1_i1.p1 TRINITY_DN63169_c0_g1~~TRINITY_DN63169_c0_g1_i1.p1  ORF type:complete len:452 (+),score=71.44 TRINITY_DN63169_c0_g1_i1:149-1504(+)